MGLLFEELVVGTEYHTGSVLVTEQGITEFARQWDPHPFHLDAAAAGTAHFGGLSASGIHTLALTHRLWFDLGILAGTAIAGAGIRRVRFHGPVLARDTLRAIVSIKCKRPTRVRERGIVVLRYETCRQSGESVFSMESIVLVRRDVVALAI